MVTYKTILKLSRALFIASQLIATCALAQSQDSKNKLNFKTVVNISDNKGSTFFSLMESEIKPSLDNYANKGFKVCTGNQVEDFLSQVDKKVSRKAVTAAEGVNQLKNVAEKINAKYAKITFYQLPEAIAQAGASKGRFDLATFYSLVSGGGVAVKIDENNVTYNVNYGSGDIDKDEMTGRSFGESFSRLALDASDKHYLDTLEAYIRSSGSNTKYFYKSLIEILLNNDTSSFSKINKDGQAVATDFVAVYIAEQDRHLMAKLRSHHWDKALLEVTLLSALHAGQSQIMVMYNGNLTAQTYKQDNGCSIAPKVVKKASLADYWQFSKSDKPENCKRSGINITKDDFTKLGQKISDFERKNNPKIYYSVARHFKNLRSSGNVFSDFSAFLINYSTPKKLSPETLELAEEFTTFLMQVRSDAKLISKY